MPGFEFLVVMSTGGPAADATWPAPLDRAGLAALEPLLLLEPQPASNPAMTAAIGLALPIAPVTLLLRVVGAHQMPGNKRRRVAA